MKEKTLSSEVLSAYCDSLAMLLSAGVSAEEAAGILCTEDSNEEVLASARLVHEGIAENGSLGAAVGGIASFPVYMRRMIAAGEESGRTEQVLTRLAEYYEAQAALEKRVRSAVLYPIVLLLVMSLILLFLVCRVLPVFTDVYRNLAGGITAASSVYITLAYALGWIAFGVTLVVGVAMMTAWFLWKSGRCHALFGRLFSHWFVTREAAAQNALAQFTSVLTTYVASGVDADTAADKARQIIENPIVSKQLETVCTQMSEGKSLLQAVQAAHLYPPLQTRLLASGIASGKLEQALTELSRRQWDNASSRLRALTDTVEPTLAAMLTISVGLLLTSVMLPLTGILGSIG